MKIVRILAIVLLFIDIGVSIATASEDSDASFLDAYFDKNTLVESPTRNRKHLSRVPENVTVITAADIEAMNAHSVAEALQRIPGLFVDITGSDFGSLVQIKAQGSKETHVLVLVDEVPWNNLGGGMGETNTIPIGTIDRIEVIKGPASSTWGSALGGVVNIITKKTGKTDAVSGSVSSTLGEKATSDTRGEVAGQAGQIGYYLYAGQQQSDGLYNDRSFANPTFFSKLVFSPTGDWALSGTVSFSRPDKNEGDITEAALLAQDDQRDFTTNLMIDGRISDSLVAHAGFFTKTRTLDMQTDEDGQYGPKGSLFRENSFNEKLVGGGVRLAWESGADTVVFGSDYSSGKLDQRMFFGDYLQSQGAPKTSEANSSIDRFGVYVNGTFMVGEWTFIPGLRFDNNSQTDTFWSPSFGTIYRLGANSLLRVTIARGFTAPGLSLTSGGGLFTDPNQELKPESVWSYQAGLETDVLNLFWLKATVFRHDLDDAIEMTSSKKNPDNSTYVNSGSIKRIGIEMEFETQRYNGFTFFGGGCYVFIRPNEDLDNKDLYAADGGLKYSGQSFSANLLGHYVWWDLSEIENKGKYGDPVWDINMSKSVEISSETFMDLIFSVHNLFNGDQYATLYYPNPNRWMEVGAKFKF